MAMDIEKTQLQKQLDKLLEKEKNARLNNDNLNSVNILKDIITLCYKAKQFEKLKQMIKFLMDRRGQAKKAQIQMIQLAMTWLNDMEEPNRTNLIETIRDVTAKKIFLQVEYARCILMIVKSKQNDNDILQAAKILQQVQVQTYGSMNRREKLEFILYQMKIMLKKEDYVRLYIISKKINETNLKDDQIADIKINFYSYMAIYYNHQHKFQEAARCYKIIWETLITTKKIIPDTIDFGFSTSINNVLGNYVGFLILHPHTPESDKQLRELAEDERIQKYQHVCNLIQSFLLDEIVSCNIEDYQINNFELFSDGYTNNKKHCDELKRMLVQHNIRVVSKYYGRISLMRIKQLNNVDKEYCQEELCTLNNRKVISCRIDRIDDIVDFRPVENQDHIIKTWNSSINSILDLVDTAANLIHREREVFKK